MNPAAVSTDTALIWLRQDGIVCVCVLPRVIQTVQDAEDNFAASVKVREGVRRALIVDIRDAEPLTTTVRQFYSGPKIGSAFTALGILVPHDSFGRILGNLYLSVASPGVPIQLFFDENEAVLWLKKFG